MQREKKIYEPTVQFHTSVKNTVKLIKSMALQLGEPRQTEAVAAR